MYIAALSIHAIILTVHQFILCVDKDFVGKHFYRQFCIVVFVSVLTHRLRCINAACCHHPSDIPFIRGTAVFPIHSYYVLYSSMLHMERWNCKCALWHCRQDVGTLSRVRYLYFARIVNDVMQEQVLGAAGDTSGFHHNYHFTKNLGGRVMCWA